VNDRQLLALFIERRDDAAFAALTRRYINLVHSTCLRETHNAPLAEDAAQAVFILLARKAMSLRGHAVLAGWLFHAARLVSKNAVRAEQSRQEHERKLVEERMRAEPLLEPGWSEIDARLHDALTKLNPKDRDAILLRFVDDLSLAEVGQRLGVTEDAARVRVNRALERLRRRLPVQGTALSIVALAALLIDKCVQPASAACRLSVEQIASHVTAGSVAGTLAGTPSHHLAQGVLKTMLINKLQIAAIAGVGVICVGSVIKTYAIPQIAVRAAQMQTVRIARSATGPTGNLALRGDFTLKYHAVFTDLTTDADSKKRYDESWQIYAKLVKEGKVAPIGQIPPWTPPPPDPNRGVLRPEEITMSARNGLFLYDDRMMLGDLPSHSRFVYDGHNTSEYSACGFSYKSSGRLIAFTDLRMDDMSEMPFPAANLPYLMTFVTPDKPLRVAAGPRTVAAEVWTGPDSDPTGLNPGRVTYETVSGTPRLMSAVTTQQGQDGATWVYSSFEKFQGVWIATKFRLTMPSFCTVDYTLTDAENQALPAAAFNLTALLQKGDIVDSGNAFIVFDPAAGSVQQQFQRHSYSSRGHEFVDLWR
jgi:RNA polymerase sigma factor (sigma-70 family)